MRSHTSGLLVLLLIGSGCGLPPVARPGHTLGPGEFQLGGFIGGTFGSEMMPDALMETTANVGVSLRAGLVNGCDTSAEVSVMRLGAHARCSVLSEHRGAPLSITPGVGAAYLPRRGPEYVASVDVGTGKDWRLAPLVNLELSRGTYFHFVPKSPEQPRHLEQSNYRELTRPETRLRTTVGFGIEALSRGDSPFGVAVGFGVSPYWLLAGAQAPPTTRPDGVTWSVTVGALID